MAERASISRAADGSDSSESSAAALENTLSVEKRPGDAGSRPALDSVSSWTGSLRALPPVDDDDIPHFIQEKSAPITFTSFDDDLDAGNDLVYDDVSVARNLETSYNTPQRESDATSFRYSSVCSIRIEPSPERTLDVIVCPSQSSAANGNDISRKKENNLKGPVDDALQKSKNKETTLERTAFVEKLDNFFGESKPSYTTIESSVYKKLSLDPGKEERFASQGYGLESAGKSKKSSMWSLSAKATTPISDALQSKVPRKVIVEREPSHVKSKDMRDGATWKEKVAKKLQKAHGGSSGPDAVSSADARGTFGVPLEFCAPGKENRNIPRIVEVCIGIIDEIGLGVQGIYRIPGHTASVNELVEEIESLEDPRRISIENERWRDANVVASILKQFFRKLPESLITNKLYDEMMSASRSANQEKSGLRIKRLIRMLPKRQHATLAYLASHLHRVSENETVNRMNAHNLSRMFGPSVVRPDDESLAAMVRDIEEQSTIMERLIKHCDWYFGEWTPDANVPEDSKSCEPLSDSANLQLLANAESLVLMQQKAAELSEASANDELVEGGSGGGLFRLGSGRLSRRNKHNKSVKESKEDSVDINRDVDLRHLDHLDPPVRDPALTQRSPALTRVDLARKVSLSAKANKKVKRRFTEKPADVRLGVRDRPATSSMRAGGAWKKENDWEYQEKESSHSPDKQDASAAVVEIKRYPAYNFVDTTIKLKKKASSRSVEALDEDQRIVSARHERACAADPVLKKRSEVYSSHQNVSCFQSRTALASRDQQCENDDDAFHSEDEKFSSQNCAKIPPMSAVAAQSRSKRYSEADAVWMVHGPVHFPSQRVQTNADNSRSNFATDAAIQELFHARDSLSSSLSSVAAQPDAGSVKRYNVVIRSSTGRKYYVLETSRPQLFAANQSARASDSSAELESRYSREVAETLDKADVRVYRRELRQDLVRLRKVIKDDIELRKATQFAANSDTAV